VTDPIFIVGTERSGSNLLRLILNEHEAITIPHPPHLMRDLQPLVGRYGDLTDDTHFRRLIRDAIRLINLHFMPWAVAIDPEETFRSARERSLYAIYVQVHEQYLRAAQKRRWGCKSTFMIRHVDDIVRFHAQPRIIHLVRDGRDVAVSARESVFSRFHPHYVSSLWRDEQSLAIAQSEKLPRTLFRTFRYEDLISDPDQVVREICEFVGEEFSPRMLRYFEGKPAERLASLSESWKNCAQPILASNFGKYRESLSSREIFEFERISHRELRHFGYMLENEPGALERRAPSRWELAEYRVRESARALTVEARALGRDRNAGLRLKKRLFLLSLGFFASLGCAGAPVTQKPPSAQPQSAAEMLRTLGLQSAWPDTYRVTESSDETADTVRIHDSVAHSPEGGVMRVRKMAGADLNQGQAFIQEKIFQLHSIYEPHRDPYFAVLTKDSDCPAKFRLRQRKSEKTAGSEVEIFSLYANDRMTYGACTEEQASYRASVALILCKASGDLFTVENFIPAHLAQGTDRNIESLRCP
jgi:hypothetical protein